MSTALALALAEETSRACVAAWDLAVANRSDVAAQAAAARASKAAHAAWQAAVWAEGVLVELPQQPAPVAGRVLGHFAEFRLPADGSLICVPVDVDDCRRNAGSVQGWFAQATSYPWAVALGRPRDQRACA